MALVKTEDIVSQTKGFNGLPLLRQLGLMFGLAASVALGVAVVMWSQSPDYRLLYSNLSLQDAGDIANALQQAGIPYKLTEDSSTLMVPSGRVHDARIRLAGQGLPKGGGAGFEMLQEQKGFGVSQFMENVRYQRALEGELARTISSMNNVRSARVHLAIPKRSAFIRNRKKPTASVMIDLFPGRNFEGGQVAAVSYLVAASIPDLEADQVTVIDQKGRLLSTSGASDEMRHSSRQFGYRQRLEDYYIKRIETILAPIVGAGGVRAQVAADIDFTVTEQTQEKFNPDTSAVRSEQTMEEKTAGMMPASGVPGSLSNQPPVEASAGDIRNEGDSSTQNGAKPVRSSRRATRNYELDKTISHIRKDGGDVRRLSVAVVVDDRQTKNEDGELVRTPLKPEELTRITGLVKEAVGFDPQRGDTVNVINASFVAPPVPEPLPTPSFLERADLWGSLKQILGGAVVIFLIFGVLRPVLRDLAAKGKAIPPRLVHGDVGIGENDMQEDQLSLSGRKAAGRLPSPSDYDVQLNAARTLASQDPKRVAQVVNNWVTSDA